MSSTKGLGEDADAHRSALVVHVSAEALLAGTGSGDVEDGPGLSIETVKRLLCDSRLETVLEDANGLALGVGRARRSVPPWLLRVLRQTGVASPAVTTGAGSTPITSASG